MPELKERILQIISSATNAVSVGDLVEELGDDEDVKPSAIRQVLAELETERKILALPMISEGGGRPKNLYRVVSDQVLEQPITRDTVELLKLDKREERQKLLRGLIEDSSGRLSKLAPDEIYAIFSKTASRLQNENPKKLFKDFAKWLKENYDAERLALAAAKNKGIKTEAQEHEARLKQLEDISISVFARMLNVPRYIRTGNTLNPGPFVLACDKKSCDDHSRLKEDELDEYLDFAIHGNKIIEIMRIDELNPPIHMGGSDASIQPISLGRVLPWFAESVDMNIVTAVGVRYDIYKGLRDFERYPDPKALAQYERKQAIEEGLLIPPAGSIGFPVEMENRIKEAAMDLRQYRKDFELMFEKEPACHIHFRDGRIFPLEHRLSDSIQHGLHGEVVRYSLKTFKNIVNAVGSDNGDTLFCGFVKRPGVDILAPLIIWYIYFGSANDTDSAICPGMSLGDYLTSPEGDSWIVSNLFSVQRNVLAKNEVMVTFRILRRFQSMEEQYVQNFAPNASREEWENRLRHFKEEMIGEDAEDAGLGLIATLCARAAILEFYCSLSGSLDPTYESSLSLPRFEILLPYHEVEQLINRSVNNINERQYIQKLLAAVYHPGILDRYPDSLFPFQDRSPKIFLAPKPVCDAHISAKAIAEVYRDDFMELLVKEARIYWLSRARKFIKSRSGTSTT